jgi:LysR family transcriptional activator of mexEF-oprN operon
MTDIEPVDCDGSLCAGRTGAVLDNCGTMVSSISSMGALMSDLRLFDLNLLVAFDALMAERNVTRAARRIGIGQPAMSYALARLRDLFGDELFVRASGAMQPTTRALELAGPVGRILGDIRGSVLKDRAFRPEATEMVFRVGASDYAEVAVLPQVLAALRSLSPRARIVVSAVDRDRAGPLLESGGIDAAIGFFPEAFAARQSEVLFHEDFVCLFDAKACGTPAPLGLKAYLQLPHILMSLRGELAGGLDALLARRGAERFVFMATPHFLTIPFLLHGFRAIAAVPRRLAENCADAVGLALSPLPVEVPGFDVSMLWHARTETDPAQRWFRDLIRTAGRARAGDASPLRPKKRRRR